MKHVQEQRDFSYEAKNENLKLALLGLHELKTAHADNQRTYARIERSRLANKVSASIPNP